MKIKKTLIIFLLLILIYKIFFYNENMNNVETIKNNINNFFNADLSKIRNLASKIRELENGIIEKLDINGKLKFYLSNKEISLSNENDELKIKNSSNDSKFIIGSRYNGEKFTSTKYDPFFKSDQAGIHFNEKVYEKGIKVDQIKDVITEDERKDLQPKGYYLRKGNYLEKGKYIKGIGHIHFYDKDYRWLICNVAPGSGTNPFCVPTNKKPNGKYTYGSYKWKWPY